MNPSGPKIMIVAGETSGDRHAAKLAAAINVLRPDVSMFGAAGPRMRETGVDPVVAADELSVVGILEIAGALPMFLGAFRKLVRAADERKPDVAVLVDFPEFNLKLAKSLNKRGIPVVYYISPQLWAWRKYRIRTIRKYVDLVLAILPFEKEWYRRQGIGHVEYVGSPLAREIHPDRLREEFCADHGIDDKKPIVALLPGSRRKEIQRILPVLLMTVAQMAEQRPQLQFVLALAEERHSETVETIVSDLSKTGVTLPPMTAVYGETYDALSAADVAAVTSGTATLETGVIGTPMAVVYKTSAVNYKILRPLIDVEHFGLINLIAGERVANELIQDDFTPETLAVELGRLLVPEVNAEVRGSLRVAAEKLGHGGASQRAAEAVVRFLRDA